MDFDENLGKVYTLSLYDGDSKGLVEISMDGMDLVCYKLSKAYFQKYKDDQDLKNKKSVYFLYGGGCFYVGQAGIRRDGTAITSRINEHLKNPEKDFLEEIVFFCQDKNEWDSGTLDYIEASLIELFEIKGYRFAHPQNHETKDKYLSKTKIHKYNTYMKDIERIIVSIFSYQHLQFHL